MPSIHGSRCPLYTFVVSNIIISYDLYCIMIIDTMVIVIVIVIVIHTRFPGIRSAVSFQNVMFVFAA